MLPEIYKITGNTYPNRHTIKSLGAKWDREKKAWFVAIGGNGWESTMWDLRRGGCKVEPTGQRGWV